MRTPYALILSVALLFIAPALEAKKVTAPEERGADFSVYSTERLIGYLAGDSDKIEQRKATKALGDRHLAGKLELTGEQKAVVDDYIRKQLARTDPEASVGEDRSEANNNIVRLWRLSQDVLFEKLCDKNMAVAEACIKNLTKMRTEATVLRLVELARTAKADHDRMVAIYALSMMTERSHTLINRPLMDADTSDGLAEKHIVPLLNELAANTKDAQLKKLIEDSLDRLKNPIDCRPRKVAE